jgi:hypothetical protein
MTPPRGSLLRDYMLSCGLGIVAARCGIRVVTRGFGRPFVYRATLVSSSGSLRGGNKRCGRQRIEGARDRPGCQNQCDQGQGPQDEVTRSLEAHHRCAPRVGQYRCEKSECEGHREQIGCGRYRHRLLTGDNRRRDGEQPRKIGNPWYLCCDVTGGDPRGKCGNGKRRRGQSPPTALRRAPIRGLGQASSGPEPCNPRPKHG